MRLMEAVITDPIIRVVLAVLSSVVGVFQEEVIHMNFSLVGQFRQPYRL